MNNYFRDITEVMDIVNREVSFMDGVVVYKHGSHYGYDTLMFKSDIAKWREKNPDKPPMLWGRYSMGQWRWSSPDGIGY